METKPALTHTYFFKNIFIQLLTMKTDRRDSELATAVAVLESTVMVALMESEVPLFSYPWEHFSFAPNSIRP